MNEETPQPSVTTPAEILETSKAKGPPGIDRCETYRSGPITIDALTPFEPPEGEIRFRCLAFYFLPISKEREAEALAFGFDIVQTHFGPHLRFDVSWPIEGAISIQHAFEIAREQYPAKTKTDRERRMRHQPFLDQNAAPSGRGGPGPILIAPGKHHRPPPRPFRR